MKKFLFLFILVFTFTSCIFTEVDSQTKPKPQKKLVLISEPSVFEFNGHEYIRFYFSAHSSPVVHNPDCKCFKKDSTIVIK